MNKSPSHSRPIRIGHVTPDFAPRRGGAEVYLEHLIDALDRPNRKQTVYQIDTGFRAENVVNVPRFIRPLGQRRNVALWYFNLRLHAMWRSLRKEDVLIVHYPFHVAGVWYHPRTIALSHGVEWHQPPKSLSHRIRKRVARWAVRHCQATVANDTNFLREMGLDAPAGQGLFDEHRPGVWLIVNSVDVDRFANAEPIEKIRALDPILYARNCSMARGTHLAVEAFAQYVKSNPDTHLLIAGNPPTGKYKARIDDTIQQNRLSEKVIFAGNIAWDEMPGYYRSARMSLVPSLFCEGTSLTALESMAAGVPTITTDRGGLADLPGEKCSATAQSLAEKMLEVDGCRKEIGANQQSLIREKFSTETWRSTWNRVVDQVLNAEKQIP